MSHVATRTLSVFAAFVTVLTMIVLPSPPARAADATVDCDVPGALQAALDDPGREPGDTLTIQAGDTCFENILIDLGVVDVTIQGGGGGATIDGATLDTVVDITPGSPSPTDRVVVLRNLTITGGAPPGPAEFGGGIRNGARLTLDNVTVIGNSSPSDGGGVWNGGVLTVNASTIAGNAAVNNGGGLFNNGTVTTSGSTIENNTANDGAGVYSAGGTATINDTDVTNNSAGRDAGGVYNTGTLNIDGSSINSNTAVTGGGGIYNLGQLADLNVTGGSTVNDNTAGAAGGVLAAGDVILGGGTATFIDSEVVGNAATATAPGGNGGGGLYNVQGSTMTVINTLVDSNTSARNGGAGIRNVTNPGDVASSLDLDGATVSNNVATGTDAFGGGVRTSGPTSIGNDTLIEDNTAPVGGGLAVNGLGWVVDIDRSAINSNDASTGGGGVSVDVGNTVNVNRSSVTRNTAVTDGGGFFTEGDLNLVNSTVSSNTAANGAGFEIGPSAAVDISFSTVTLNTATGLGGGVRNSGTTTAEGMILFGNTAAPSFGAECSGALTSGGFNLVGSGTATCGYSPVGTDVVGGDPRLGPLTSGSPEYQLPGPGSDAIDAGGACALTVDQNGDPRPEGSACDIGAVETENLRPPVADDAILVVRGGTASELVGGASSVLDNDGPDPEGDPLTAVLGTDVSNGTLVLSSNGTFTYTHDGSTNLTDSFTYTAFDFADSAVATVTISVSNDAPVAVSDTAQADRGKSVSIPVLDNDMDPQDDELTPEIVTPPTNGTAVVEANGTITYTNNGEPNPTDSFTYRANDGSLDSNVVTVSITVLGAEDLVVLVEPNGRWHLRFPDATERTFFYGNPGDVALMGDWDGDGLDTPGMFRPSNGFVYLTNTLPPDGGVGVGDPALTFFFGRAGDQVVVGDWDGDGIDTLGIRRQGKMFLTNINATSVAEDEFFFGVPGDIAFGGDPDGDGEDSIFLYRATSGFVYYTNETPGGPSTVAPTADDFFYGVPSDEFVIGDWDGDGVDTVGIFRPPAATVFIRNSNTLGPADESYPFGAAGWIPVAGVWS